MQYTENEIKMLSIDPTEYDEGCKLYYENSIISYQYNHTLQTHHAIIQEKHNQYTVILKNGDSFIARHHCTCQKSKFNEGFCRHTIALLKYLQGMRLEPTANYLIHTRNDARSNILSLHTVQIDDYTKKEKVNIEMTITSTNLQSQIFQDFYIQFKIGMDRLYILKNIPELIKAIKERTPLYFGKEFTFIPEMHTFSSSFLNTLKYLEGLYDIKLDDHKDSIYDIKKIRLSSLHLNRILKFWIGKTIYFEDGLHTYKLEVTNQDLPNAFVLSLVSGAIQVDLRPASRIFSLGNNNRILICNDLLYLLSYPQSVIMSPFLEAQRQGCDHIQFEKQDKIDFIQNVIPVISDMVTIPESIQNLYRKERLRAEIYLDRDRKIVSCKVNFNYGNTKFTPYLPHDIIRNKSQLVLREKKAENRILHLLENAGFELDDQMLTLKDDILVSRFVFEYLPHLTKLADVYYTKSFKQILKKRTLSPFVRLNNPSHLLEIDFDIDSLNAQDLLKALDAYRSNRNYFRLKDGTFLGIDDQKSQETLKMFDDLNIKKDQIENGIIHLPLSQAFYLKNNLSDQQSFDEAFNIFYEKFQNHSNKKYSLPSNIQATLREYQILGYQWLKTLANCNLGGVLADDMGLGKTLQTITFLLSSKQEKPSIVIAPTSLVYNWQDEIMRFAPTLKVLIISGLQSERQQKINSINDYNVVVTSYPLIRRDIEMISKYEFYACILDEAQYIKNANSLNARAAKQIKADCRFALTGTPIENSLTDLWSIFDFILPGYLSSYHHFRKKYEIPIIKEDDKQASNLLLSQIKPFVLRRMKKEVLTELPEKIETKISIEMTPRQKEVYQALLLESQHTLTETIKEKGFKHSQMDIIILLTRLRQVCCHPSLYLENYDGESGKLNTLIELIKEAIEGNHKILVFSQFTSMLHKIADYLERIGLSYYYLDGQTPIVDRGIMVKKFNEGKKPLFLISLKAGGTGLNLTGADMVIHVDPWWNPAVEEQATDRAYRLGQHHKVQVFKLITRHTIEDKIFELQNQKKSLIDQIIQPGENFISKLSEEELFDLFSTNQND